MKGEARAVAGGETLGMTNDLEFPHLAALFATVVAAIVVAFLMIAAISPNISVDTPGVSKCRGTECGAGRPAGD